MDSYRQTLAVHYLGNLRPADTIQLSQRSVRVGSTTSSDFCIPSDSLGEVSDASPLLWQFVTGRSGVVVRNWSSHGHWNGAPFSDVLLKAGDQLTLGAVTLELVPSLTPSAADETPVEAPGCEFEGENPVAEDTVFNSQSSDLPDLPPVEEAKTSGRTPVRRKRRVTGRRRSLLSTECSKDNERPAWVDAFLAEQRTVLVTLREDVDSTRSQISQLGAYWTVRPANESEPVPTAGLPAAWDTFLKSNRFSECSISDITSIDQAIEFVADRLDQLQRERDELETLCHELSAKVETLESDFGDQSKQLREMQTELFTAVTELRELRTFVEEVAAVHQANETDNLNYEPIVQILAEQDVDHVPSSTCETNSTQSDLCEDAQQPFVSEIALNQSADLSSLIDAMEHEVDEFTQLSMQSDSILYPLNANPTTRTFIEESRLLEELDRISDEMTHAGCYTEENSNIEENSTADDMTRTMVVDLDLDGEEEPLRPLEWERTSSFAPNAEATDGSDRASTGRGNAPEFQVPQAAPPVSAASILESMGVLPGDYDDVASPVPVATAVARPVERVVSEEDVSIQQYMEQLLQRLGGSSAPLQTSPLPVSVAEPETLPQSSLRTETPQHDQRSSLPGLVQETEPMADEPHPRTSRTIASSDDDMVSLGETIAAVKSRVMSTELTSDLSAMRELANISARTAIDHHVRQRWVYAALGKVTVSVAALVTAIGLAYVSKSWFSISTWGSAIALVIGAFWSFQAFQIGRLVVSTQAKVNATKS